jgi:hypothetical protein
LGSRRFATFAPGRNPLFNVVYIRRRSKENVSGPFKEFKIEFDDEVLGNYRVEVDPSPQFESTWGAVAEAQEIQRQFIEDAIREKLERENRKELKMGIKQCGNETIKVPFTKPLTVLLTRDIPAVQEQADKDLKAIEDGSQIFVHPTNEAYFHRLRLRVAEKPKLASKIAVFYQDENEKQHEVPLDFNGELRWPPGFGNELWNEEAEIMKVRYGRIEQRTGPLTCSKCGGKTWQLGNGLCEKCDPDVNAARSA